jgi:hypothetical protein
MSAVREYLKTQHLFTMKAFLSPQEDPDQKVWFHFNDEGKVTSHSFEPADKEWDGSGPQPVITPMGRFESEAKMNDDWTEFIDMAEEEEHKQLG